MTAPEPLPPEQLWTLERTLAFIAETYGDEAEIAKQYALIVASEIVYDYESERAAQSARIAELEAQLAAAEWEPAPYRKIPGDDPMFIRNGRVYYFDWEEWDSDEWPGDWPEWDLEKWETHASFLSAMVEWKLGGDEDWLIMRRKAGAGEQATP